MATRITIAHMNEPEKFFDGIPKEQVQMVENWKRSWCIRFYANNPNEIAPIIAKGNVFERVKAKW